MGPFDIVEKFRNLVTKISPKLGEVFNCMYCFPSWVGLILSIMNQFWFPYVILTPFYFLTYGMMPWYFTVLADMFITSGGVYLIDCITKKLLGEKENGE